VSDAKELLAQALKVSADEIGDDAAIGVTERWDSLAHMQVILALEAILGNTLATDELVAIASLQDLQAILDRGA
jgi:acyl carrier protein